MPFDKIKKYLTKKDDTHSLLENGAGPSTKEIKIDREGQELQKLLHVYNFKDDQFLEITNYLTKSLNQARIIKNQELIEYFVKQQKYINKFLEFLKQLNKNNIYLKDKNSYKIQKSLKDNEYYILSELEHLASKYLKNKEAIQQKTSLIDNGPYLNIHGLHFPSNSNESNA